MPTPASSRARAPSMRRLRSVNLKIKCPRFRYTIAHTMLTACAAIVATATPRTPQPKTPVSSRSPAILSTHASAMNSIGRWESP